MKVIHVGLLNYKQGGPALSTYLTIKGLRENGIDAYSLSCPLMKGDSLVGDVPQLFTKKPFIKLIGFEFIGGVRNLLDDCNPVDLIHIQGIWSSLPHYCAAYAFKHNIPYIIAPRGSLYPQALSISSWKKKLSMMIWQDKEIRRATCIQATCKEELLYFRDLGYNNPVAIIPNPIDCKELMNQSIIINTTFRFGYLGRLHPRKKIEKLIYAFANRKDYFKKCELLIIGSDIPEYEDFLRSEVKRLGLTNVIFTGFLQGEEKDKAIRSLSCLINPSDFENFGNVINEALVRGIPAIATKGSPWEVLEQHHCGWWIDNDQESIERAMINAYEITENERTQMGLNGKQLVNDEFSVGALGKKMKILYEWILKGGVKPSFVYYD